MGLEFEKLLRYITSFVKYFGNIKHHNGLERAVIEGVVHGRRDRD